MVKRPDRKTNMKNIHTERQRGIEREREIRNIQTREIQTYTQEKYKHTHTYIHTHRKTGNIQKNAQTRIKKLQTERLDRETDRKRNPFA